MTRKAAYYRLRKAGFRPAAALRLAASDHDVIGFLLVDPSMLRPVGRQG